MTKTRCPLIAIHATLLLTALSAAAGGCGSSQSALQAPVYARCAGTGVSACNELTDGVVLFADGEVDVARAKLWQAGTKSPPEKLRAFAAALLELGASPGAEPYAEPMLQVSSLLEIQANRAEKAAPPPPAASPASAVASASPSAKPADPKRAPASGSTRLELHQAITADTDPARLEGGAASPGASPAKVPCSPQSGSKSAAAAYCIKAIEGPFVVTDLRTSSSCANDLFVAVGSSTSPRWAIPAPSSAPLAIHGARLFVREGEFLFVGAEGGSPSKISADPRCSLLWSGFRPYSGRPGEREHGDVQRDLGF